MRDAWIPDQVRDDSLGCDDEIPPVAPCSRQFQPFFPRPALQHQPAFTGQPHAFIHQHLGDEDSIRSKYTPSLPPSAAGSMMKACPMRGASPSSTKNDEASKPKRARSRP